MHSHGVLKALVGLVLFGCLAACRAEPTTVVPEGTPQGPVTTSRPASTSAVSATTTAVGTTSDTQATPAGNATLIWTPVATWQGSGTVRLSSFRTTSAQLRIRWQATGYGFFLAEMRTADGSPVTSVGNLIGPADGTTLVRTPPGMYYLEVTLGSTWSMIVEEQR
jgi:hypothetical protein